MNEAPLRAQEKLYIIDQIPLFANLSLKDKRLIAKVSVLVEHKKGEILYKEGDLPDALYCVVSGRLKVYVTKKERREDLEYLKRGRYVGIISLLTSEPHSVTVQAINDSIILKIPKDSFDDILKHVPQLAIHLSQTLSRRLKKKDMHEKRIFESTIISVFGTSDKIGTTYYAQNLAVSLKAQTNKRIILLNISEIGEEASSVVGLKVIARPLVLDSPFFDDEIVKASIFKHPLGIDVINIPARPEETTNMISLLSFLTNDYHYILLDLPIHIDQIVFESIKQSDIIHLVTAADESSLHLTGRMISELEKSSSDIGQKVKVVISEYGIIKLIDYANRRDVLKHDIYATLPDINKSRYKIDKLKVSIVIEYPDTEYSRAIRRISREIGNCLIGLALSSGAAFGMAHIGVLKVIEKEKIPIDVVCGSSIGALIGALWASGKSASDIEAIASKFKSKMKALGLIDLTLPKRGFIKGSGVRRFLRSQFGDMTFYDLRLPFKVVTCDIEKREEVVLERGRLVDAIMASVAIPGVFEPVMIEGRLLVDGGIINPLPTNLLMRIGVSKIIAVNALPSPEDVQKSKKKVSNIFDIIVNSFQASEYLLAEISCQNADIAMHPVLPTLDWHEFYEGSRVIRRGEEEASKYIPQLKELLVT